MTVPALKAKAGLSTSSSAQNSASCRPASLQFYLPQMPVPLSACFKDVGRGMRRRAPTGRYETFKRIVDKHIQIIVRPPLFPGPVRVCYVIRKPDRRRRDLGNLLKALDDTLTRNLVIEDDSQIVDLRIGWTLEEMQMPVLVQVEAVNAP
jgi:Holliday junction resolvase RusA-like endonuclease